MKNKKFSVIISLIAILMVLSSYGFYQFELKSKPIIQDEIDTKEITYLYDFYVGLTPNINNRLYLGSEKGPISIIGYVDATSEASKAFISEIFPQLKEDYIDTGLAKFYIKNHLTLQDFKEKNKKYIISKSLLCVIKIDKEKYYPFYFDLYEIEEIKEILRKHKISGSQYDECMEKEPYELNEEISETEKFGLQGINARFYIGIPGTNFDILDGVPKYRTFNKTIRNYEFIVGN